VILIFAWGLAVTVSWQANIMNHEKGGSLTLTKLLQNYLRVMLYGPDNSLRKHLHWVCGIVS
jgi:hypothetical protein